MNESLKDFLQICGLFVGIFVLFIVFSPLPPDVVYNVSSRKTEVFLAELESGLSGYELDHGHYPVNPSTSKELLVRDREGAEGATLLYKELSGDFDMDGHLDADGEVYVRGLLWQENQKVRKEKRRSAPNPQGGYYIIDNYGKPIRYLSDRPNEKNKLTMNSSYDLWSIEKTAAKNAYKEKSQRRYISNWARN